MKRNSGSHVTIEPVEWKPSSALQVPVLEDPDEHAVRRADREQVEHDRRQRDRRASGTSTSSSRNATRSTNANDERRALRQRVTEVVLVAVSPVTAASTPGTRSSVAGITVRRSVRSAANERRVVAVPASGTSMRTTVVAALRASCESARARCRGECDAVRARAIGRAYRGRLTSVRGRRPPRARRTGEGLLDRVVGRARSAGSTGTIVDARIGACACRMPAGPRRRAARPRRHSPCAGSGARAAATSAPDPRVAALALHPAQQRLPVAEADEHGRLRRASRSERGSDAPRRAPVDAVAEPAEQRGSTVSDPTIATSTTSIAPSPSETKSFDPDSIIPAHRDRRTVRPDTSTARPDVAAARAAPRASARPRRRSSRSRLR